MPGGILDSIPLIGPILGAGINAVGLSPKLEDEVTVEVLGQPGSTKRELYRLAMATGFGLVRRFDVAQKLSLPPGMMMIEYDAADHWVRFTLRYKTSILTAAPAKGIGPLDLPTTVVFNGPEDQVVGGAFNFTTKQQDENGNVAEGIPKLTFTGRTILSSYSAVINPDPATLPGLGQFIPSPNPKPQGDNRSRGSALAPNQTGFESSKISNWLIPLVFSNLSKPGTINNMQYLPPTSGATGG